MSTIIVDQDGGIVTVQINRPDALNALNSDVMNDMVDALAPLDGDPNIGCFIITGSEKAFAAGADIKQMSTQSYMDMLSTDLFAKWDSFANLRTPKIAAVAGFALGGGCELAMMCDIIIAADNAKFGQPEIKLGIIPGMGGSQRLTKLIGRAKAMDMVLTGRMIDAEEADRAGLVSRVVPLGELMAAAKEVAATIAGYSKPSVTLAKESVDRAEELGLAEGIRFERRLFHSLFSTDDQKEGMAAFSEKRKPNFQNK